MGFIMVKKVAGENILCGKERPGLIAFGLFPA